MRPDEQAAVGAARDLTDALNGFSERLDRAEVKDRGVDAVALEALRGGEDLSQDRAGARQRHNRVFSSHRYSQSQRFRRLEGISFRQPAGEWYSDDMCSGRLPGEFYRHTMASIRQLFGGAGSSR